MEKSKNKDKILRICNYCFSIVMIIITVVAASFALINKGVEPAIRCIGPIFHIVLIYIIELICRRKFSNFILLFYNIYVFFAAILGTTFDFYNLTYYDDLMHTIFGYVGCIIGLYLLVKMSDYEKMSTIFIVFMTMFVAMGCAAIWEILEYLCDKIIGTTAQGTPVNGIVSLQDTMNDLVVSFIGMTVFEVHFIIHRKTKKKLIIANMIENFTQK